MKIAFTGASSTGKTTLAQKLLENDIFNEIVPEFIHIDVNSLIIDLKLPNFHQLNMEQRRCFRLAYLKKKVLEEKKYLNFLTDRSFVDIATYWILYDSRKHPSQWDALVDPCKDLSKNYDVHFFFPLGRIPFQPSNKRSMDLTFHYESEQLIRSFLIEWDLEVVEIMSYNIEDRVEEVLNWLCVNRIEKTK